MTDTHEDPAIAAAFTLATKLTRLRELIERRQIPPLDALQLAVHYETQAAQSDLTRGLGQDAHDCIEAATAQIFPAQDHGGAK